MTSVTKNMKPQDEKPPMSSSADFQPMIARSSNSKAEIVSTSAPHMENSTVLSTEELNGEEPSDWFDEDVRKTLEAIDQDEPKDEFLPDRPFWANKVEYLMAQVGYSVGLSTIWRFPYLCLHNGGGKPGGEKS